MNAHSGNTAPLTSPFLPLLLAVLVQAAKIIVSVSKGVAQWRKGLKTNGAGGGGGTRKNKKNNGTGVAEDEQGRLV